MHAYTEAHSVEEIVAAGVYIFIHRRFVFLGVRKGFCLCERKLGHLELSVCFQTSQSMASSLHVKEWLDGCREEDKRESLFFIPQASCLLAPHGASEPKERWLLGYRWAVGIQEWKQVWLWTATWRDQDRGKQRQRDGKVVDCTRRNGGRGEENGIKADVSVSACSQNVKVEGKQNRWDVGEECAGWYVAVASERDGSRRLWRVTREMSKVCCLGGGAGVSGQPDVEREHWSRRRRDEGGLAACSSITWNTCGLMQPKGGECSTRSKIKKEERWKELGKIVL